MTTTTRDDLDARIARANRRALAAELDRLTRYAHPCDVPTYRRQARKLRTAANA